MTDGRDEDLTQAAAVFDRHVPNPSAGLPDPVFYCISRMTPLINVDLLIKDENGRILLAWRDDRFAGTGWHVPGGIIRFRETMVERLRKVMQLEIGTEVAFDPEPVAIHEIIADHTRDRGHFISLLFNCRLSSSFAPANSGLEPTSPGFLQWHDACPDNLLPLQGVYRRFMAPSHMSPNTPRRAP